MKNTLLLILTNFALLSFVFSQSEEKKKRKNKWGCAIAINSVEAQIGDPEKSSWGFQPLSESEKIEKSFSLSIIPKYLLRNDFLFRFEIGFTNLNFSYLEDYKEGNHTIAKQSFQQEIYRIIPGIQWDFLKKSILQIYCGVTISYVKYNFLKYNSYGETRQLTTDTLILWSNTQYNCPGGFSAGIGAFTGFYINLKKYISIGAEFSSTYSYYKLGGRYEHLNVYRSIPNPLVTLPSSTYSTSYNGFQFSKLITSINFSLWF